MRTGENVPARLPRSPARSGSGGEHAPMASAPLRLGYLSCLVLLQESVRAGRERREFGTRERGKPRRPARLFPGYLVRRTPATGHPRHRTRGTCLAPPHAARSFPDQTIAEPIPLIGLGVKGALVWRSPGKAASPDPGSAFYLLRLHVPPGANREK